MKRSQRIRTCSLLLLLSCDVILLSPRIVFPLILFSSSYFIVALPQTELDNVEDGIDNWFSDPMFPEKVGTKTSIATDTQSAAETLSAATTTTTTTNSINRNLLKEISSSISSSLQHQKDRFLQSNDPRHSASRRIQQQPKSQAAVISDYMNNFFRHDTTAAPTATQNNEDEQQPPKLSPYSTSSDGTIHQEHLVNLYMAHYDTKPSSNIIGERHEYEDDDDYTKDNRYDDDYYNNYHGMMMMMMTKRDKRIYSKGMKRELDTDYPTMEPSGRHHQPPPDRNTTRAPAIVSTGAPQPEPIIPAPKPIGRPSPLPIALPTYPTSINKPLYPVFNRPPTKPPQKSPPTLIPTKSVDTRRPSVLPMNATSKPTMSSSPSIYPSSTPTTTAMPSDRPTLFVSVPSIISIPPSTLATNSTTFVPSKIPTLLPTATTSTNEPTLMYTTEPATGMPIIVTTIRPSVIVVIFNVSLLPFQVITSTYVDVAELNSGLTAYLESMMFDIVLSLLQADEVVGGTTKYDEILSLQQVVLINTSQGINNNTWFAFNGTVTMQSTGVVLSDEEMDSISKAVLIAQSMLLEDNTVGNVDTIDRKMMKQSDSNNQTNSTTSGSNSTTQLEDFVNDYLNSSHPNYVTINVTISNDGTIPEPPPVIIPPIVGGSDPVPKSDPRFRSSLQIFGIVFGSIVGFVIVFYTAKFLSRIRIRIVRTSELRNRLVS